MKDITSKSQIRSELRELELLKRDFENVPFKKRDEVWKMFYRSLLKRRGRCVIKWEKLNENCNITSL